jgi:hypothetical protein
MSAVARTLVERHAEGFENLADAMQKDGIGLHATRGHVVTARKIASDLRATASAGAIPFEYANSVYASASSDAPGPVRHALRASGLDRLAAAGETVTVADLNTSFTASTTPPGDRILLRQYLSRSGQLTP